MRLIHPVLLCFLLPAFAWAEDESAMPQVAPGRVIRSDAQELPPDFQVRAGRLPNEVVVSVSVTAENIGTAEKVAKDLGQKEGLRFLLKSQDPQKAPALMQMMEGDHIKNLVRTMSATDELRTVAIYKATLHVLYDAAALEAVLGAKLKDLTHDAPKTVLAPAAGQGALLIPVWTEGDKVTLWNEENAWRKAVGRAALEESKGRLILLNGDPVDKRAVSEASVGTLTFSQTAALAERYGVSEVLIAEARPMAGNSLRLQLTMLNPAGAEKKELLIAPEAGADAALVMRKAASEVANLGRKRFQNAAAGSDQEAQQTHQVRILAPITRAADWVSMRGRLMGLPMVESVSPIAIGTDSVELDLTFRGPPDRFGAGLKSAGIHVTPQADKLLLGFYPIPN